MRTKSLSLLVLGLLFLLFVSSACKREKTTEEAPAQQAANQGTAKEAPPATFLAIGEAALREFDSGSEYIISGKIANGMEEPITEATISIYAAPLRWTPPNFELSSAVSTQTSDDAGNYQIRLNLPQNLWISVKKEGYASVLSFIPVRDTRAAVRDYHLQTTGAILGGIVTDKKDQPISGATVVANIPPFTLLADSIVLMPEARVTDASGKFTFEDLPDGDVSLVTTARGFTEVEQMSPLKKGSNDILNFVMPSAAAISIPLKNGRGETLPYATAMSPGYFKIAGSDKRGIVEFSVPLEIGPIDCTFAAEGYITRTLAVDPKSPPAAVVLEDRPLLKGKALDDKGTAIPGTLVGIFGTGGAQGKFDVAVLTDAKGAFEVPLSYPPAREIRVSRLGYVDRRIPFDKSKDMTADLNIRMKPVEAGLFGRVIDYRGIPVKRFVLHLKNKQTGAEAFQSSYSVDNGKYAITTVAPGVYELVIQSVASSTAEDVQVVHSDQVEVKKGFLLGEIVSQFPKPRFTK